MNNQKVWQFNGTAGGYFIICLLSALLMYIPFFGWAFIVNYVAQWIADNSLVMGRKIVYRAGYGETLKFVIVNSLLVLVTFGIYSFWFVPKMYRYVADHVEYADGMPIAGGMAAAPTETVLTTGVSQLPVNPTPPQPPTTPANG